MEAVRRSGVPDLKLEVFTRGLRAVAWPRCYLYSAISRRADDLLRRRRYICSKKAVVYIRTMTSEFLQRFSAFHSMNSAMWISISGPFCDIQGCGFSFSLRFQTYLRVVSNEPDSS